ncbi:HAMP domain-containing sensor histidine kinase [Microbacterium sp.]|uniref:sensor histidine kinase n=1 Tax=Microbacterium sp. TaxID=51671 RepID=UPI0025E2CF38|nr:HAMP domain-containing sensor histidine kinase [Microbacterium sp.]
MPPASDGRSRRAWSLAARITALVVSATAVVAIVAAVLTLQLLRSTIQEQTRAELVSQLALVAASDDPQLARQSAIAWADQTGAMWAVIDADGAVSGTATTVIDDELIARLRAAGDVSDVQLRPSEPVILEGELIAGEGLVLARTDYVLANASRELIQRVIPVLLLGLLGAVLAAAVLARRITRPLVQTAAAADRLAAGERSVGLPASEIPEVHSVADALTALDEALAASEGRQREFLLSISHELRTPLTAIRGYGEALVDGVVDADAAGAVIESEAARLSSFVDDLLELARLEADDFTIELSRVDLADVARAAHRAWLGHASGLGVELGLAAESPSAVVETDGRRARQLVDGLIENALRVTPEGGAVRIAVAGRVIRVADNGPGLAPDDLAHVFDRGVLRARYANARPVGTGLGLSIAARLAPRIGASIAVGAGSFAGGVNSADAASVAGRAGTEFLVTW